METNTISLGDAYGYVPHGKFAQLQQCRNHQLFEGLLQPPYKNGLEGVLPQLIKLYNNSTEFTSYLFRLPSSYMQSYSQD
jgi:hypothetical protein